MGFPRVLAPAAALGLLVGTLALTGSAPPAGPAPSPGEPSGPVALFPDRVFVLPPGAPEGIAHFFFLPSRRGERKGIRLRLRVRDPDGRLRAVAVAVDDGPWLRADRRVAREGPLEEDERGQGFHAEDTTGYFEVPLARRRGPHRLVLRPVLREPGSKPCAHVEARLLGARLFDASRTFRGIRDLSDLLHRRYRDLRNLDLEVRKVDMRGQHRVVANRYHDHWGEAERTLFRQSAVEHLGLLNELHFRGYRDVADPVAWMDAGMQRYRRVFEPWLGGPRGARMGQLYAATPQLYEYMDEVSNAFAHLREGYYPLAGLTVREDGPEAPPGSEARPLVVGRGDPVGPFEEILGRTRDALERLIEAAAVIAEEFERSADAVSGEPHTSIRDFPRVRAEYRRARKIPVSPLEPRYLRAGVTSPAGPRGLGLAAGEVCVTGRRPDELRRDRDVRGDRLEGERDHLAWYLKEVRALAHHDLHLVRLWQAMVRSSPPALVSGEPPRWFPRGGLDRLHGGRSVRRREGTWRSWRIGGSAPRPLATWEATESE